MAMSRRPSPFPTSLHIIEALLGQYPDIDLTGDNFMVISPDENTINRCIFYASMLRSPLGIFYRNRDNPMAFATSADKIQKEYLGDSVKGKDCLIIDDMLDSGRTVLDRAIQLKERGARRIFVGVTFAHFTDGYEQMNGAKNEGVIEKIFAIPGLGQWMIHSINGRDYPMILGLTVFFSAFLMVSMFLVDVLYSLLDPRIRFAKEKLAHA